MTETFFTVTETIVFILQSYVVYVAFYTLVLATVAAVLVGIVMFILDSIDDDSDGVLSFLGIGLILGSSLVGVLALAVYKVFIE